MKSFKYVFLILLFLITSCKTVKSDDPNYSVKDLKAIVGKIVKSLSMSNFIKKAKLKESKSVFMLANEMSNDTDEHINTRVIMEKMRTKLINENGIHFIDDQALDTILEQQKLQQSDLFNDTKALKVGKLVGAKVILRGRISNIRKKSERKEINFYNITLQLVGLETARILWTDEVEISKKSVKSLWR